MRKYIAIIIIGIILTIFASVIIRSAIRKPEAVLKEKPETLPPLPKALVLELVETNEDTFENELFGVHAPFEDVPFYIEENEIIVAAGEKDPVKARNAKVFLVHRVIFDGVGRNGGFAHYYMFDRVPAEINLEIFTSDNLELTLDDSLNETLAVRLLPGALSIVRVDVDKNYVTLECNGKRSKLGKGQEALLSELSKDIRVSKEYLAPIPKGKEIEESDIKIETRDFGSVKFSTKLTLKNSGSLVVKIYE